MSLDLSTHRKSLKHGQIKQTPQTKGEEGIRTPTPGGARQTCQPPSYSAPDFMFNCIVLYWRSYLVCIFHPWSFCPVLLVTTENPHLRRFYTGQIWKAWRHELHSGDLHKLKNFPRINIDIMFGLTNLDSTFGLINFVSLSYIPKSLCITNNPHCPHFPNTFWL